MRKTLAASLLAVALAQTPVSAQSTSSVNARLQDLEQTLKNHKDVASVMLCETPGATKAIVHVREAHYIDTLAFRYVKAYGTPEEYERARQIGKRTYGAINNVQRASYGILSTIADKGYPMVYADGIPVEDEEKFTKRAIEQIRLQRLSNLITIGYFREEPKIQQHIIDWATVFNRNATRTSNEEQWVLLTPQDEMTEQKQESYRYIPGAELLLAAENRIILRGFERRAVYDMAMEEENDEILMDGREDTFLDMAAANEEDILPVFLGGSHTFAAPQSCPAAPKGWFKDRESYRDNLGLWNKRFSPIYSLLEVTPRGTDEIERINRRELIHDLRPLIKTIEQRRKREEAMQPKPEKKGRRIVGEGNDVRVE